MNIRPIFTAHILTTINAAFHYYARSLPSVVSLECPRCGLKVSAQHAAGTFALCFEIDLARPNLSRSKHSAVLTSDGRLSISCESDTSDSDASVDSGRDGGTCSLAKNSGE